MKIHILSDLHLEFAAFNPEPTDADVVVLAGDIDVRSSGVGWARDTFPDQEIIYVVRIPAQRDRPFQQYDRSFQMDCDR